MSSSNYSFFKPLKSGILMQLYLAISHSMVTDSLKLLNLWLLIIDCRAAVAMLHVTLVSRECMLRFVLDTTLM